MQAILPGGDDCEEGAFLIIDEGHTYAVVVDGEVVARVDDHLASAIEDPPHVRRLPRLLTPPPVSVSAPVSPLPPPHRSRLTLT